MKFRTSFQISRPPKEDGSRPTTSSHFKMHSLLEKQSKTSLNNGMAQPKDQATGTPTKKAMQEFLQKTGANLKATGANLKATGAKLERRIPRRKSKVVKPSAKRNSQIQVQTYDIDEALLDRIFNTPDTKQASAAFYDRQRKRVITRTVSPAVSPISTPSRSDHDSPKLSPSEVEAMFNGAPRFMVEELNGRKRLRADFGGKDVGASTRHPKDNAAFGHSSFAASTLRRSRSHEEEGRAVSNGHDTVTLVPGCDVVEIPSMLGAQGLDPGAVGFDHFLELPISDRTLLGVETNLENRGQFRMDPEWLGLRELDMEHMIIRLNEIGELHAEIRSGQWESPAPWSSSKIEEMGEELFAKLLSAELGTTSAGTGSVTLKTQISALQRVLNTKHLWHDFSSPEWRLRLGQLLWSSDESGIAQLEENQQPNERDFLLLQITLAAELLIRLHALDALSSSVPPFMSSKEVQALESQRSAKVRWDVILAERFLGSINIAPNPPSESEKKANRNSVFSAITFFTARETDEDFENSTQPILTPKNEAEQLAGLVYFAESIQWPHAEDVKTELQNKLWRGSKERPVSTAVSIYATPLSSPRLPGTPGTRTNYFGFPAKSRRQGLSRTATSQSIQLLPARNIAGNVESFEVGGWLSRSWLSGLVMPGEAATHFLMSALLENSPQAIAMLGEEANLYGGFVYKSRSYWSKSCVVGRVLAASNGATECMGWISVPSPVEMEERWIELDIKQVNHSASELLIKDAEIVEKDSSLLHDHDSASIRAENYTMPVDESLAKEVELKCDGLVFTSSTSTPELDHDASVEGTNTSIANLSFSSPINSKIDQLTVPLSYNVQFVSAFPCYPQMARLCSNLNPPASSSLSPVLERQGQDSSTLNSNSQTESMRNIPRDSKHPSKAPSTDSHTPSNRVKELPTLPVHPLHIDCHYGIVPVVDLLSMLPGDRPQALCSLTEQQAANDTAAKSGEVVTILDCRGTQDLELLARAWCAKIGRSALIAKSGRTCLSCCIREATALGLCIVIRT